MPRHFTPAPDEIGLKDILGTIRRHRNVVRFFTLLAFAIGVAIALTIPRLYAAKSLVMLQTPVDATQKTSAQFYTQPLDQSIVLSEVEVLRSRDIAEALAGDMNLAADPMFWQGVQKPADQHAAKEEVLRRLIRGLSVKPIGRSLVLEISYEHPNADMTAKIVNRMAEIYQEQQIKNKVTAAQKNAYWLNQRLKLLSNSVRDSARAVEEYRARENLMAGTKDDLTVQQVSELSTQLITAQADLAVATAKNAQLARMIHEKKSLDDLSEISKSRLVGLLKRDEATLHAQYADLRSRYGPRHPRILAVQAELAELNARKHIEISKIAQNMGNDVLSAQARVDTLQATLSGLEQKRRRENNASIGLRELERDADANRAIYETFLNRYKEAAILGDVQQPDAKIISTARVPSQPAGASPLVIIALSTLTGFVFGLLAVLVLDQLDHHIRTPAQLSRIAAYPTLAMIGRVTKSKSLNMADFVLENPHDVVTEAVRSLRVRLFQQNDNHHGTTNSSQILAVTSSLAGEGKTTTSLWLARLLAGSGASVLLIDAAIYAAPVYTRWRGFIRRTACVTFYWAVKMWIA